MHVCHLITGLGAGGTPVMLKKVLESLGGGDFRFSVIGLIEDNVVGRQIEELGIRVERLGMRPGRPSPTAFTRLVAALRRDPPDVLQTWLYHADLLGWLAARWCGRPPVIWNIRHATLTPGIDSRSTRWTARACARLSWKGPQAIVVNSAAGRDVHIRAGYCPDRFQFIPNGFDLERFRSDPPARSSIRLELGVGEGQPLIGVVARYSPLKGQATFIQAMQLVATSLPDAIFVLCGRGADWSNAELTAQIGRAGGPQRWRLLGLRGDVPAVQAALDLAVCPSFSEAFSNSIGEALACGVPCVATDVGDSAALIGSAGRIVPAGNAPALAQKVIELLNLSPAERQTLAQHARSRIESHFDIREIAHQYARLWTTIDGRHRSAQAQLRASA